MNDLIQSVWNRTTFFFLWHKINYLCFIQFNTDKYNIDELAKRWMVVVIWWEEGEDEANEAEVEGAATGREKTRFEEEKRQESQNWVVEM